MTKIKDQYHSILRILIKGYSDLEVVKEKKDLFYFLISPIIIIFYRPLYAFIRFKGYLDFIFRRDPVEIS